MEYNSHLDGYYFYLFIPLSVQYGLYMSGLNEKTRHRVYTPGTEVSSYLLVRQEGVERNIERHTCKMRPQAPLKQDTQHSQRQRPQQGPWQGRCPVPMQRHHTPLRAPAEDTRWVTCWSKNPLIAHTNMECSGLVINRYGDAPVLSCVEPQHLSLWPQPAPPEDRVNKYSQRQAGSCGCHSNQQPWLQGDQL